MLGSLKNQGNGKYANSYNPEANQNATISALIYKERPYGSTGGTFGIQNKEDLINDNAKYLGLPFDIEKGIPTTTINIPLPSKEPSKSYILIIRSHFIPSILSTLEEIQPHAGTANAAVFVDEVLHCINDFSNKSPEDPLLEMLLAFYDAISANANWADYSADQYEDAKKIIAILADKYPIQEDDIEKAIMKLEESGFNTTPYGLDA